MSLPLVTRFGADPLLDLEVANKRYVDNSAGGINSAVVGQIGNQSFAINNVNGWFSKFTDASTSSETGRSWVVPQAANLTLFIVNISANGNTVDGATWGTRTNQANANQTVTIDQATGFFQDITNSDPLVAADICCFQYRGIDGASSCRSAGAVFTPT